LNSILRNITKIPEENLPDNVVSLRPSTDTRTQGNENTPKQATAENLEKKLAPLIRNIMRVINGQKELCN
jgi:hypothetical protein